MAGERNVDQVIANHMLPVLRTALVEPTRFIDALPTYSVYLEPGQPIGVVNFGVIHGELLRTDANPRFVREAARAIFRSLGGREAPKVFTDFRTVLEQGREDGNTFFRRSDIGNSEAFKRVGAYQALLNEEAERVKAEKAAAEERKKEENQKPSTAVIKLVTTFSMDTYRQRVQELRSGVQGREVVEEIPHDVVTKLESAGRTIQRSDARKILNAGLTEPQFDSLLQNVREGVISRIDEADARAVNQADVILQNVEEVLEKPGRDLKTPIYLHRDMIALTMRQIGYRNQNPNIRAEIEVEEILEEVQHPLPRHLTHLWAGRFDEQSLTRNLEQLKSLNPEIGEVIAHALLAENPNEALRNLRSGGDLVIEGREAKRVDIDQALKTIVLPDQLIAQSVMADLLGEMYPMIYSPDDTGKNREMGLFTVRYFAQDFTTTQIRELLEPRVSEKEVVGLEKLEGRIAKVNEDIGLLRGNDRPSIQKRQALEKERARLEKNKASLEKGRFVQVPIRSLIQEAFAQRVPLQMPKGDEYGDGEESVGFRRAMQRYELTKDARPADSPPNPDDYILEEDSEGYKSAWTMHQAYLSMTPEAWTTSGRWRAGRPAEHVYQSLDKLVVSAMVGEGVFASSVATQTTAN